MVKIVLKNHDSNSPYQTANINLKQGICVFNDNENESINISLFKTLNFNHPLLSHPTLCAKDDVYSYIYQDLAGLFETPKYIFATLIQSDIPANCLFNIRPSEDFLNLKTTDKIPLSSNANKCAQYSINIHQLNTIISNISGETFQFQDTFTLHENISLKDLPPLVHADALYKSDEKIFKIISMGDCFKKFELRFINNYIGFGLYAREAIKKSSIVCLYFGEKKISPIIKSYSFHPKMDSLNMFVDAINHGNIARFINHAPNSETIIDSQTNTNFLNANLNSRSHSIFGIEVVVFYALRNISKGEQLLTNYGQTYFEYEPFMFKKNGDLVNENNKKIVDKYIKKKYVHTIMKQNGIRSALFELFKRSIIAIIVIIFIAGTLRI